MVDYTGDFAIVQSSNFTTLFVLSREREVEDSVLDVSTLVAAVNVTEMLMPISIGLDRESWSAGFQFGQRDQE